MKEYTLDQVNEHFESVCDNPMDMVAVMLHIFDRRGIQPEEVEMFNSMFRQRTDDMIADLIQMDAEK